MMRSHGLTAVLAMAVIAPGPLRTSAAEHGNPRSKVTLVYDQPLPNVPGKSMKGVLVEYAPGGSSAAHRHPGSAFIYATVLEGAVVSQVNDGPEITYQAGQNFSENPGDRHGVSRNASTSVSAKLLAVFVVDSDVKDLVLPY
ncbi:cupin domain-containing protein [Methylobacterium nigriterrae]|uniref:cupin domain-containing protein n=1 Tax=Methylobacterium nigriterrae TaxID=3127512 RepID=UPI003013A899